MIGTLVEGLGWAPSAELSHYPCISHRIAELHIKSKGNMPVTPPYRVPLNRVITICISCLFF